MDYCRRRHGCVTLEQVRAARLRADHTRSTPPRYVHALESPGRLASPQTKRNCPDSGVPTSLFLCSGCQKGGPLFSRPAVPGASLGYVNMEPLKSRDGTKLRRLTIEIPRVTFKMRTKLESRRLQSLFTTGLSAVFVRRKKLWLALRSRRQQAELGVRSTFVRSTLYLIVPTAGKRASFILSWPAWGVPSKLGILTLIMQMV